MAKKKSKITTQANAKARKPSARKPTQKSSAKQQHHEHDSCNEHEMEIELDATERKAVDLVLERNDMCSALEAEVNRVVTNAVRKICKEYGAPLTIAQAQNVAMMLFGD
jgi:hypothetical protein